MATKMISLVALAATIVPGLMYFFGMISHDMVRLAALVGTIAWFIATPMWMEREQSIDATEVEI